MMRHWWLILAFFVSAAAPAFAQSATGEEATATSLLNAVPVAATSESEASAPSMPAMPEAVERLMQLPSQMADPAAWRLAILAQLESQGAYPPGTVDSIVAAREAGLAADATNPSDATSSSSAASAAALGPPRLVYKDTYVICDLDQDGTNELVQNEYDLRTSRPVIRVLDGRTGYTRWLASDAYWFPLEAAGFEPYNRPGDPLPDGDFKAQNFAPLPDIDGDGFCDLLYFTFGVRGLAGVAAVLDGEINAVDAHRAYSVIWSVPFQAVFQSQGIPGNVGFEVVVTNFPTGFLSFDSATGPNFLFKTSDLYWAYVQDPPSGGQIFWAQTMYAADHLQLRDTTTGALRWQRDFEFRADGKRTNFTFISGVGDVAGDAEPEIFLDQFWFTNPRGTETDNPFDGSPLFRYGKGMDMLAVAGEHTGNGATLWTTTVWDDGAARVQPPMQEESFEELVWTHAIVLPDITEDGRPDPMALVLTQEGGDATTINGQFRTHFVPLDGATGVMLWGNQVKYQGWGFAAPLQDGNATDFIAIGTIDLPTPPPPEGRFPAKDVRLAVLHSADGTPVWSYEEQFSQDSYVAYHMALLQYRDGLAPLDLNGDGLRDLVTPNQYIAPSGDRQVLLSTATSSYEVLDGATGHSLRKIVAFGSNGIVLSCAGDLNLTVVSGYGQHLEMTRFNAATGKELWNLPLWLDDTLTSATAGVDLNALGARCQDTDDGRTMVTVNMGLYSLKRGYEFVPIYGYPHGPKDPEPAPDTGGPKLQTGGPKKTPIWLHPTGMLEKKSLLDAVAELMAGPPEPTLKEKLTWNAGPAVPGLLAGLTLGILRNRKIPKKSKSPKLKLPELYGGK